MILGAVWLSNPAQSHPSNFILQGIINAQVGTVQLVPIGPSVLNKEAFTLENKAIALVNGTFQFEGWVNAPYGFYIKYGLQGKNLYRSTLFVLEKGNQTIRIDLKNPNPILTNETMQAYYKSATFKKKQRLQKDIRWLHTYSDSLTQQYKTGLPDSLLKVIQAIRLNHQEREENLVWELCERLPTSFYAFWSLYNRFDSQGYKPEQTHLFSYFTDEVKHSKAGQLLAFQLNKANRLGLGKPFPEGKYKNLKTNQLEVVRPTSKYTLVEFWWSGCGICLQHIPQLRKLHTEYSEKGFAIIGISTDKTERVSQLDKLLSKYQFIWPEYLDENSINADKIGVLFYPTYLLLDDSGKIVNNNVRLSELSAFLEKRLN